MNTVIKKRRKKGNLKIYPPCDKQSVTSSTQTYNVSYRYAYFSNCSLLLLLQLPDRMKFVENNETNK